MTMPPHNLHTRGAAGDASHLHRIGSVSRLADVPVSTLRMWESRYGAFSPRKSAGRHRLYAEQDVVRARLLRQLTHAGHSIGRIARASVPKLQRLLTEARLASPDARRAEPARLSLVVVNAALAARLGTPEWAARLGGALLDVRAVFMDLAAAHTAEGVAALREAGMLLARVNALQASHVERLLQLKAASGVRHALVLYGFAPEAAIAALRGAGFLVRREPVDDAEIAELLRSATWASGQPAGEEGAAVAAALPARRFSEDALAQIAAGPSHMLCECPRHLSDIITQLASFEEYSAHCLNDSEDDAHVHAQLRSVAGSARALFEGALALVIAHDAARAPKTTGR